ncbi:ParB N-terminal domain-containing protein [Brevibacillus borstelensis]|jgi:L-serine kinase (ATP) / ParB family transcriptional regulator, heme-responsive regulator|uniref:ParB N-terminal domain-containing protein n=1 Tax=Brevibacillus borstelensis TaxID=45462 RepID=UPI000F080039|nr:ParB N-terminal domain-containing protein [Brevibacillus borstelensis]MBE5396920.1 ParB N-terminal domain-containing protein [Brevibacillus borstelensis]MCM3623768.1 ParB N-terminal domain-containing protein [Brevibacillus borstelensis]MED1744837.1 ParB N-terminal domain-containing protein [Brevibacillus borstelensis]MED1885020.1 ParB N-terminal domain-containing protein [Brevibacillus borstelensis]RNB57713.1 transcriptional regulator [Brevibacillus borstelensis]
MSEVLLSLQLIELDQMSLHEEHEPSRLERVSQSMREDGFLRHPILATEMRDGRYLVLDGAHRIGALRLLGYCKVPVQVARQDDFSIEAWHHLVPADAGVQQLFEDPSLHWTAGSGAAAQRQGWLEIVDEHGNVRALDCGVRHDFLEAWHKVVSAYNARGAVKRVPAGTCLLPDSGMLLIRFKPLSYAELERVMEAGRVLPAGVTRFQINGRLLNLKIPLHLLHRDSDVSEWERLRHVWRRSLRLYTEQVYLCEI